MKKPTVLRCVIGCQCFLQQFRHRRHIEHLISDDPLRPVVLRFEFPELTRVRAFITAELPPPRKKRRAQDAMSTAKLVNLLGRLILLRRRDILFVADTAALDRSSPFAHSEVKDTTSQ